MCRGDFIKDFIIKNKKSIYNYSLLTFLSLFLGLFLSFLYNFSIEEVLKSYSNLTDDSAEKSLNSSYFNGFLVLFINNFTICIQILLISLVPIRYLYSYFLIITNFILGILLYSIIFTNESSLNIIFYGLLPHYFIEMFGFIISCVVCSLLNVNLIYRINSFLFKKCYKNKSNYYELKELFFLVFKVYVFIVLPFILFGSLIEGFVSRFLSGF